MRRAKPRRLRSNRRVERATAKTAFLAANASGGVHREAHRLCPVCSAGADLREQGWQGAKHDICDVSNFNGIDNSGRNLPGALCAEQRQEECLHSGQLSTRPAKPRFRRQVRTVPFNARRTGLARCVAPVQGRRNAPLRST